MLLIASLVLPADGVYKSGFATTQKAYEAAVKPLFASLNRLEKMLTGKDYLIGNQLTEADIRLFVTIVGVVRLHSLHTDTRLARSASTRCTSDTSSVIYAQSATGILLFTCVYPEVSC